jgi:hypothetical protein
LPNIVEPQSPGKIVFHMPRSPTDSVADPPLDAFPMRATAYIGSNAH